MTLAIILVSIVAYLYVGGRVARREIVRWTEGNRYASVDRLEYAAAGAFVALGWPLYYGFRAATSWLHAESDRAIAAEKERRANIKAWRMKANYGDPKEKKLAIEVLKALGERT